MSRESDDPHRTGDAHMSESLRRRLRLLEEDYPDLPPLVRKADLEEINALRTQLGMPQVDDRLNELGVEAEAVEEAEPEPEPPKDHTEARAIYEKYLKKSAELEKAREYAERVAAATAGRGQTPVRPLATMGTDGGPLLCDQCNKPMRLEGGGHHGAFADTAWRSDPRNNWKSWILGGMVLELQTNGTLRVYHGYPGRGNQHCCNIASREDDAAREEFRSEVTPEIKKKLREFLADEFPRRSEGSREELFGKIVDTLYSYDPGFGVNRPGKGG